MKRRATFAAGRLRHRDGTVHAVVLDAQLGKHYCGQTLPTEFTGTPLLVRWTRPTRPVTCPDCWALLHELNGDDEVPEMGPLDMREEVPA